PQPDPLHHPPVRRHGDLATLAAAQDPLARAGGLLPRRSPPPPDRRGGLHRPDRRLGDRHARDPRPLGRGPLVPLDLAPPSPANLLAPVARQPQPKPSRDASISPRRRSVSIVASTPVASALLP